MWVAFALQKLLTFFSKKFQNICISLHVNFNESLTNDIVSFEQLGPGSLLANYLDYIDMMYIMKYFLRSFSSFRWFKKGSCQFLAKECAQDWLTA